jgi:hypothetical protein
MSSTNEMLLTRKVSMETVYVVVVFDPPELDTDAYFSEIDGVYFSEDEAKEEANKHVMAQVRKTNLK